MSRSRVKVKGHILVRVRVGVKFGLLLGRIRNMVVY